MLAADADYDNLAIFYDLEYGHKENDLDFYLDMAKQNGAPILEIGVGTGRVAIELAKHGFDVYGIDNSREMLRHAEGHIKKRKKDVQSRIKLNHADMRDFHLGRQFPLAIIPFRAFLHNITMEEQLKTLLAIKKHLQPNGLLVFDLFVPLYSVIAKEAWGDKIEEDELAKADSGISIDIRVEHQPVQQLLIIKNTYLDKKDKKQHSAVMQYRYIFRYEMEALLRCAGYTVVDVYGGFEKQPYDFYSGIMVFIARNETPEI